MTPLPLEALYDLTEDSFEMVNLAYEDTYLSIRIGLEQRLTKLVKEIDNKFISGRPRNTGTLYKLPDREQKELVERAT